MDYARVEWRDGQPYSPEFDDIYFSANDGRSESEYVFLQRNDLAARFATAKNFVIAETGFGSGLNFALTLKLWHETAPPDAELDYIGIEIAPLSPEDIARVAALWPDLESEFAAWLQHYPLPMSGQHCCLLRNGRVRLHLVLSDAQAALAREHWQVDAWYLDGFAPASNPQLWNQSIYRLLAQNSAPGATLATFSAAGAVRRGLETAGFVVTKCKGHGNKREMITASYADLSSIQQCPAPWFRVPEFIPASRQATVIGAGLAGLTVAWALVRRGWQVRMIDKHATVAGEASGNPVGLVMPRLSVDDSLDARVYRAAFLCAVTQLDQLQAAYAESHNGQWLWRGEGVCAELPQQRAEQMLAREHYPASYLHALDEAGASGMMQSADTMLLQLPQAGWASPNLVCAALLELCGEHVQYIQADVTKLRQAGSHWQAVSTEGGLITSSELLVLANGVSANNFSQSEHLPLAPVRGQATELQLKPNVRLPISAYTGNHYLASSLQNNHSYYCGASYDLDDHCRELRQHDQQVNLNFVAEHFPDCFEMPDALTGFVGFRAVSEDRLPIVGALPEFDWYQNEYADLCHGRPDSMYGPGKYLSGLYVSAAHGSRGLTTSFLAAEIIAAQVEATPAPVASEICEGMNPARFIIRRLKRGV